MRGPPAPSDMRNHLPGWLRRPRRGVGAELPAADSGNGVPRRARREAVAACAPCSTACTFAAAGTAPRSCCCLRSRRRRRRLGPRCSRTSRSSGAGPRSTSRATVARRRCPGTRYDWRPSRRRRSRRCARPAGGGIWAQPGQRRRARPRVRLVRAAARRRRRARQQARLDGRRAGRGSRPLAASRDGVRQPRGGRSPRREGGRPDRPRRRVRRRAARGRGRRRLAARARPGGLRGRRAGRRRAARGSTQPRRARRVGPATRWSAPRSSPPWQRVPSTCPVPGTTPTSRTLRRSPRS